MLRFDGSVVNYFRERGGFKSNSQIICEQALPRTSLVQIHMKRTDVFRTRPLKVVGCRLDTGQRN